MQKDSIHIDFMQSIRSTNNFGGKRIVEIPSNNPNQRALRAWTYVSNNHMLTSLQAICDGTSTGSVLGMIIISTIPGGILIDSQLENHTRDRINSSPYQEWTELSESGYTNRLCVQDRGVWACNLYWTGEFFPQIRMAAEIKISSMSIFRSIPNFPRFQGVV